MARLSSKTRAHLLAVVIVTALFELIMYALRGFELFSLPYVFSVALLLESLLVILIIHELFFSLQTPLSIAWSLILSAWEGMMGNPWITSVKKKYPRFSYWLHRRFLRNNATGIFLTIGIIISLILVYSFLKLTQDIVLHDSLVKADERILKLMPLIRTASESSFFSFITFLANWQSLVFITLSSITLFLIKRQRFPVLLMLFAVLSTQGISSLIKIIVGRIRPDPAMGILSEVSYSFPSGHTLMATVVFGLISYYAIRSVKNTFPKILIALSTMVVIFFVGLSRIYLGVHYPSDVLGSLVLGAFLLNAFVTISLLQERYHLLSIAKTPLMNRGLFALPVLLLLFSLVLHGRLISLHDEAAAKEHPVVVHELSAEMIEKLPHYSEGLTGNAMEPISFIVAATPEKLQRLFLDHSWYQADAANLSNTLRAVSVAFRNEQYLTGPVTPVFMNGKPHDIAFEQPTAADTFRQRHHIRFWKTELVLEDGRNVWVATASLDQDVKFTDTYKLPTHRIDPNIDGERDYIVTSLELSNAPRVRVVEAQLGQNAAGDSFFTDGRAILVDVK